MFAIRYPFAGALLVFCAVLPVFAQNEQSGVSDGVSEIERLLQGYLEHDAALQELGIKMQQSELGLEQTKIENGIDVNLSTGTMRLLFENGAAQLSVEPQAELTLPALNGTSVSVSAPLNTNNAAGSLAAENTHIAISTEITAAARKRRELALLRAERSFLEAKRALAARSLETEKKFFETLRALYEGEVQALGNEETAYTKEIELAVVQSQGYTPSSVRYRTVRLEADNAHRTAEEQRRALERKLAIFSRDCGIAVSTLPEYAGFMQLEDQAEFGQDDEKARFSPLEKAQWSAFIGKLERKADGQLELRAQGGITANNTALNKRTSADTSLSLRWKGINVSLGGQFPLSGVDKSPAITLSLAFRAANQRIAALGDAEKQLVSELETLALVQAERNWEETVDAVREERAGLVWERTRLVEQYGLYRELAADTTALYRQGYISESEYRKALTNEKRSHYQVLTADLKIRIHFIAAALYFVEN